MQLLRNAFDVVETINTNDDFAILEPPLQSGQTRGNSRTLDALDKLPWVDSNWKGSNLHIASFELDAVGLSLDTEDASAGGEEVTSIVVGVESSCQSIERIKPTR